jgi:hypothetical protein
VTHPRQAPPGLICLYNSKTYEKEMHVEFPKVGIIRTLWHPRLNQIFASTSSGRVNIYFDIHKSYRYVVVD